MPHLFRRIVRDRAQPRKRPCRAEKSYIFAAGGGAAPGSDRARPSGGAGAKSRAIPRQTAATARAIVSRETYTCLVQVLYIRARLHHHRATERTISAPSADAVRSMRENAEPGGESEPSTGLWRRKKYPAEVPRDRGRPDQSLRPIEQRSKPLTRGSGLTDCAARTTRRRHRRARRSADRPRARSRR